MTKEHYHKMRANGLCPYCKQPVPDGYRFAKCPDCLAKDRRMWAEKKREEKIQEERESLKRVIKKDFISLDDMAKEAHEKHLTYGQLQRLETLKRRDGI